MDELTIQLVRVLQNEETDEAALERVAALLPEVRAVLREADDDDMRGELIDLLERWAGRQREDERAAAALRAAAETAESDLGDWERAADLYELALRRAPLDRAAIERLEVLLDEHGEDARLEVALMGFTQALAEAAAEPAERARALRKLGKLRAERLLDADTAIAAYEGAVEMEPTATVMTELAALFERRADVGDDQQAADLYCRLGGICQGEQAIVHLRRALDLVPDHQEALELLEPRVPASERVQRLRDVYEAFVSVAPEGPKVAAVRAELEAAERASGAEPAVDPPSPAPASSLSPMELAGDVPGHRAAPRWRSRALLAAGATAALGLLLFLGIGGKGEPSARALSGAAAGDVPVVPPPAEPPAPPPRAPALPPEKLAAPEAKAAPAAVDIVEGLVRVHGGELDRDALTASLRAALPALDRCYTRARQRLPRLQGRLVYAFTVDRSGRAKLIKHMRGTIHDSRMRRCIGAALRATRFARPSGRPARITTPFVFRAE